MTERVDGDGGLLPHLRGGINQFDYPITTCPVGMVQVIRAVGDVGNAAWSISQTMLTKFAKNAAVINGFNLPAREGRLVDSAWVSLASPRFALGKTNTIG